MIDKNTIKQWRHIYGLDKRSPLKAAVWWAENLRGCVPVGTVSALGFAIDEIERLQAEIDRLTSESDQ